MQESTIRETETISQRGNKRSPIELEAELVRSANQAVRDAVISGFGHFGGRNVVDSLLYILELEHAVDMNALADNISSFRIGIHEMFGSGAYVLEEHVCEELARILGIGRDGQNLETLVSLSKKEIRPE